MALIVTGVHRSGTSMIAGILSNLAIPMGEGAQMNPAPENPEGFFERIDVMQLNDSVLRRLGGSWQAPPNIGPESWFSFDQNVLANFRSSIDLFSGSFNSWFVKDPRISLILPIWDRLALTNLSLIFSVRNPQSVAQSLHLRNGLSHRRALALWWIYNQQLLANVDSRDTLFIDYDSAKRSKKATTEKIASFALKAVKVSPNVNFDSDFGNYEENRILDSLKIKKAEQSINSKLSRSSYAKVIKGLAKSEIDDTMDFYAVLKNLHGSTNKKFKKIRTPDWVFHELQNARVEFELTQTIEKLHDHLETSKIEIATLNQLSESTLQTHREELEIAQSAFQTQGEEMERLQSFIVNLEEQRDDAHNQVLLLHNESEKHSEELEIAQSAFHTQGEEMERLQSFIVNLEEQRDDAYNQVLLLHNESEKERKESELAQNRLQTQGEELERLKARSITLEAERESAQNRTLLLHNESEKQRKEFGLAQNRLQAQSEELERLKARSITLEAERESAQNQTLLLRNESEKQRREFELAQNRLQTQSEEIERLQSFIRALEEQRENLQTLVIALEAQGDSAQNQAIIESAKVKKLTNALSAISVDLAEKKAELNRTFAELESAKMALGNLQGDLNQKELFSQRLEKEFQNQIHEFFVVENNNKNLEVELGSIKSSRGYRLISKYWKFKAKWPNVF